MTDKLVPNILDVRSKMESEHSDNLLTAVGDFANSLENKIADNNLGYLICLNACSLSLDDFPDETTGFEQMGWVTADLLIKRLNYDLYHQIYGLSDNKEYLDEKFGIQFNTLLHQFNQLLTHSESNIATIEKYTDVLRRKKATSKTKNKWGDSDDSDWKTVLHDFAQDKLTGSSFMSFSDRMPDDIKEHAKSCNLDNLYARFVNSALESALDNNTEEASIIETGEEFEIHIKRLIEARIPDARTETTPRSGDKGADLLIHANEYTIAIQAKYYTGSIGNSAVQEIYTAKSLYKADFAIVVTNSSYTKPAQDAANELNVILATEDNIVDIVSYLIE